MKKLNLGKSRLQISPIAYGFWRFGGTDVKTARTKVETALEMGINLMDHADIYGVDGGGQFGDAELLFGKVLQEAPHLRDQMVLATKGGIVLGVPYDSSGTYLEQAVDNSLKRLGVDVIDLWQIHRPDFLGHPEEIAATLTKLRNRGKIKEVGVSNYTPSQFRALQAHLSFPIASHQPEFSCWAHEPLRDGILDQCLELSVTPLAWSPLGGGRLAQTAGDLTVGPDNNRLTNLLNVLDQIADEQGKTRTQVALAWVLRHPAKPIPILGTQRPERIQEGVGALDVTLSRPQWNAILVAAQGEPLP